MGDLSRFWLSCLGPLVLLLPKLSKRTILSVPDEGYSRNASCALNLISTFLFRLLDMTMYILVYVIIKVSNITHELF